VLACVVIVSESVDEYSPPFLHRRHLQQQQQSGDVQWVVEPGVRQVSQDSATAANDPALTVASTPTSADDPAAPTKYSEPSRSAPVDGPMVKDEHYDDECVNVTQLNHRAVSGFTVYHHHHHHWINSLSTYNSG